MSQTFMRKFWPRWLMVRVGDQRLKMSVALRSSSQQCFLPKDHLRPASIFHIDDNVAMPCMEGERQAMFTDRLTGHLGVKRRVFWRAP